MYAADQKKKRDYSHSRGAGVTEAKKELGQCRGAGVTEIQNSRGLRSLNTFFRIIFSKI
jgi:hypothetical protein